MNVLRFGFPKFSTLETGLLLQILDWSLGPIKLGILVKLYLRLEKSDCDVISKHIHDFVILRKSNCDIISKYIHDFAIFLLTRN